LFWRLFTFFCGLPVQEFWLVEHVCPVIRCSLAVIEREERIRVDFPDVDQLERLVRQVRQAQYSVQGFWHLPCNRASIDELRRLAGGIAEVDVHLLRDQLRARLLPVPLHQAMRLPVDLSPGNFDAFRRYLETLQLKAYSGNTIRVYRFEFLKLLQLLRGRPVEEMGEDQVRAYMLWLIRDHGYGESQANSAINAIKFYFEKVLDRPRIVMELPRPKKPLLLPRVLGKPSIERIIRDTVNLKHRAMLMLAYSAGLRVSEVVALRICDIDSDRMSIHVTRAKGKKDRVVGLSPKLLDVLREYFRQYRPRTYLFEGADGGEYSTRAVQQVFRDAKQRAGVRTPGGIHTLRHSYATHLLESGTDIRFIQELLGHNSILTTRRYTHVSLQQAAQIRSPLDDLSL
jgi:site-specific recombinase XerD